MFEIGFSELILVMIVGLIVLGPERLPVAVKTVSGWIRAMRSLASSVQNELTQELKLQELQDSLKKVEKSALQDLSPELKASMDELRAAAQAMQKSHLPSQASEKVEKPADANVAQSDTPADIHNQTQPNPDSSNNNSKVNVADNEPVKAIDSADNSPQSGDNR